MALRASRTSSILKGLMMAMMIFMSAIRRLYVLAPRMQVVGSGCCAYAAQVPLVQSRRQCHVLRNQAACQFAMQRASICESKRFRIRGLFQALPKSRSQCTEFHQNRNRLGFLEFRWVRDPAITSAL